MMKNEYGYDDNDDDDDSDDGDHTTYGHEPVLRAWPLVDAVMKAPLPPRFAMPDLPPYTGKSDPFEHVNRFRSILNVWGASDGVLCRVFPATLAGPACNWFWNLKPGSISRFEQLSARFQERFACSRVPKKIADTALFTLEPQQKTESLRSWVSRFSEEVAQVDEVERCPGLVAKALCAGLQQHERNDGVSLDLELQSFKTLRDLTDLVEKHIQMQEWFSMKESRGEKP